MTAPFVNKGRNSWIIPNTHRVHSVRIPGPIHSANDNSDRLSWSTVLSLGIATLVGAWFVAHLVGAMA